MNIREILKGKKVLKIYVGRDSGCRCGCGGVYYKLNEKNPFDTEIYDVLQQALEISEVEGVKITEGNDWVNISYGDDKAYTIYYERG